MSSPPYEVLEENPETYTEVNQPPDDKDLPLGAKSAQTAAAELYEYIEAYYQDTSVSDIWDRICASRLALHGYPTRTDGGYSHQITNGGKNGNLPKIKVNHYRNIHTHSVNQTTQEEPSFQPVATNTDSESIKQCDLVMGLLDYYKNKARLERVFRRAAEDAFCDGEGFVVKEWDNTIGEDVGKDPETNTVIKTGDFRFSNKDVYGVIRDITKTDHEANDWLMIRDWVNKFEVVAQNPALKDKILKIKSRKTEEHEFRPISVTAATNDIAVYTWFHKKTKAVPEGRLMVFLEDEVVLYDGPLPYREIPIYRIAPADFKDTVFGYSPMWDLLGLQENYDILMSIILANQKTFGHQVIALPKGSDVSIESLGTGLSVMEYNANTGAKPEPVNFTQTAPEIFNHLGYVKGEFETLSSVSATVRGAPPASLESGSSIAAVYAQFQSYMSNFTKTFKWSQADCATGIIHDLQDFGDHKRTALIAGKNKRYHVEVFSNKSLNNIDRVVIENGNPLAHTMQGKMATAEMLINMQALRRPEELQNVLVSGKLEPLVEGERKELDGIREENEMIANGMEPPDPLVTDNQALHLKEHQGELATMAARSNPAVRQAGLMHMQKHLALLADPMNMMMLQALGQQSMAMPPMPGGDPSGTMPPGPGGTSEAPGPGMEPSSAVPAAPEGPEMPQDPISGGQMAVPGSSPTPLG